MELKLMDMIDMRCITSMIQALSLTFLISCVSCGPEDGMRTDTGLDPEDKLREVFEFQFNETSGTSTQETFTNNSFSIAGSGIHRMEGVQGNALFFDGLSNEVTGTLPANLMPNRNLVVSIWASPKSFPIGTAAMLAMTSSGSNTGVMIGVNKFGQIVIQYFIDGTFSEQITDESLARYQWSHVVVGLTPEKQYAIIYLNGVALKTSTVSAGSISWPAENISVSLGKNTMKEAMGIYDIDYFSGALDEVKIYAGEATQENVNEISNYEAPDQANYSFDIDFSEDNNRPTYHPIPDYGWANESYGLIHQGGKYHMFYQKNEVFLGISQQNWGHFTSTDLVNWEERNAVLWPSLGWDHFGIWSGDAIILQDGTPAVVYTGVDGVKAGIGIATSTDDYKTLHKSQINPVIPKAPDDVNMDFRDPYVWFKDGKYHMIIGSGIASVGGNVVYYTSIDFETWNYEGIPFQGSLANGDGGFWEMPVMYEFPNGKEMLLVQKTPDGNSPARTFYWIGQFENGTFTSDFSASRDLEIVNGFLSPAVTTDNDGLTTAIGIIPDEVSALFHQEQGWANLFSVPQVWELDETDNILIRPHPNLISLRENTITLEGLSVQEGGSDYLNGFTGRHFEMEATINTGDANEVGFIFGKTPNGEELYKVYYDIVNQEWVVDASSSSVSDLVRKDIRKGAYPIPPGSTFNVRIFIDGSVLEVFIDDLAHFTGRFFPTLPNATGVDLFAKAGTATVDATIYTMNN